MQLCKLCLLCCELESKLLKINQFQVGEISKLLCALNVKTPCITNKNSFKCAKSTMEFIWVAKALRSTITPGCLVVHYSSFHNDRYIKLCNFINIWIMGYVIQSPVIYCWVDCRWFLVMIWTFTLKGWRST